MSFSSFTSLPILQDFSQDIEEILRSCETLDHPVGDYTFPTNDCGDSQEAESSVFQSVDETNICDSTENTVGQITDVFESNGNLPSTTNFPGDYNFSIELDGFSSGKKSWVYSHVLQHLFIDMNKVLMVQFRLRRVDPDLFIRAMLVYSGSDHISVPVDRCTVHSIEDDPSNKAHETGNCCCHDYKQVGHVLRVQKNDAVYCYNMNTHRHSVVVPVTTPEPGTDLVVVPYYFTCKSSCPTGMQRRQVCAIFTLEDRNGCVFGRTVVPVKICSCPKRDKERMEKDYLMGDTKASGKVLNLDVSTDQKRHSSNYFSPTQTKKLKIEKPSGTGPVAQFKAKVMHEIGVLRGHLNRVEEYVLNFPDYDVDLNY